MIYSINERSGVSNKLKWFTLLELLVTVSIMVILLSLLLPTLSNAKATARTSACLNNLRQFGIASGMYVNDNSGYFPVSQTSYMLWDYQLMDYINYDYPARDARTDFSIFHCPAGTPYPNFSRYRSKGYGYNVFVSFYPDHPDMYRPSSVTSPAITALMTDLYIENTFTEAWCVSGTTNRNWVNESARSINIAYRHAGRVNLLFADLHVRSCGKGLFSTTYGTWRPAGAKWYNEGAVY